MLDPQARRQHRGIERRKGQKLNGTLAASAHGKEVVAEAAVRERRQRDVESGGGGRQRHVEGAVSVGHGRERGRHHGRVQPHRLRWHQRNLVGREDGAISFRRIFTHGCDQHVRRTRQRRDVAGVEVSADACAGAEADLLGMHSCHSTIGERERFQRDRTVERPPSPVILDVARAVAAARCHHIGEDRTLVQVVQRFPVITNNLSAEKVFWRLIDPIRRLIGPKMIACVLYLPATANDLAGRVSAIFHRSPTCHVSNPRAHLSE